jgi:hypothetical protein
MREHMEAVPTSREERVKAHTVDHTGTPRPFQHAAAACPARHIGAGKVSTFQEWLGRNTAEAVVNRGRLFTIGGKCIIPESLLDVPWPHNPHCITRDSLRITFHGKKCLYTPSLPPRKVDGTILITKGTNEWTNGDLIFSKLYDNFIRLSTSYCKGRIPHGCRF